MKKLISLTLCFTLLGAFFPSPGSMACSSFCLVSEEGPVCGQNYDWHLGDGLVLINKRGLSKQGLVDDDNPAEWVSRYGSVTFNQYGREFPCGGMNEEGLVIIISMLNQTRYPRPDERPAVNVPQWIQYQLDTAASVDEVIASDEQVRIAPVSNARVHFFVADREGNCATIEFLRGQLVHHTGDDLPVRALTNSSYQSSVDWIKQFEGFGGERPIGGSFRGSRFATAANRLRTYDGQTDTVDHAFATLENIAQGSFTKWSVVYDPAGAKIHFRTGRAASRRLVDLAECDFSTDTPAQMLDVNAAHEGDLAAKFVDYSPANNRRVVTRALRRTGVLNHSHSRTINRVCNYPETCQKVSPAAATE